MGKTIKNTIYLSISITLLWNCILCGQRVLPTSLNYRYHVEIDPKAYSNDSVYLTFLLESMLARHITPFKPPSFYTKSTKVTIDSILYSQNKVRIVVLIISKVRNEGKKLMDSLESDMEYNANFIFCDRKNIEGNIKAYDYGGFTLAHYDSYDAAKQGIYEYCFGRRATDHPWNDKVPSYNMDDSRFWNSEEYNTIVTKYKFIVIE